VFSTLSFIIPRPLRRKQKKRKNPASFKSGISKTIKTPKNDQSTLEAHTSSDLKTVKVLVNNMAPLTHFSVGRIPRASPSAGQVVRNFLAELKRRDWENALLLAKGNRFGVHLATLHVSMIMSISCAISSG